MLELLHRITKATTQVEEVEVDDSIPISLEVEVVVVEEEDVFRAHSFIINSSSNLLSHFLQMLAVVEVLVAVYNMPCHLRVIPIHKEEAGVVEVMDFTMAGINNG
jgi:hypothetical protein